MSVHRFFKSASDELVWVCPRGWANRPSSCQKNSSGMERRTFFSLEQRENSGQTKDWARQPLQLNYWIIWTSLCKKHAGKGGAVWHTAIRHRSTDLISSPLCSQAYNNVKRFMKPFFGQRSQNSVSAYLILRNVLNLSVQLSRIPFPLWHLYRKVKLAGKRRRTFSPAAPWDSNNIFSQNVSLYIPTPPPPPLTLPLSFL